MWSGRRIDGADGGRGNMAADTAPAVQAWQRYPARVTLTVDDAGMTPGADTYYAGTVLPIADAAGVPVGAAITVGYTGKITPIMAEIQGWINAGRDVTSHSVSHTYYTNTDALDIQYTGSGTAATMSISGKVLTIAVTGAPDSVIYNLAQGQAQGTIQALRQALQATGKFTATEESVPGAVWDGMFGVHEGGVAGAGSGGRERSQCEEGGVSHAVGCDAADDGRTDVVAAMDDGEFDGVAGDAGVCVSGRI